MGRGLCTMCDQSASDFMLGWSSGMWSLAEHWYDGLALSNQLWFLVMSMWHVICMQHLARGCSEQSGSICCAYGSRDVDGAVPLGIGEPSLVLNSGSICCAYGSRDVDGAVPLGIGEPSLVLNSGSICCAYGSRDVDGAVPLGIGEPSLVLNSGSICCAYGSRDVDGAVPLGIGEPSLVLNSSKLSVESVSRGWQPVLGVVAQEHYGEKVNWANI